MRNPKEIAFHRRLLTLGLAVAAVAALACGQAEPRLPRLVFLGLDGASWKVIGPLIERGELPAFARLTREGAFAPEFDTLPDTRSPLIWTTIATGRAPEDHGITDFTAKLPNGQIIPVTSSQRRVRAVWEVASERGLSAGVIGWWATWPAETIRGYVVSDHANPAYSELLLADRRYWTADPELLARLARDVHPPEIAAEVARSWWRTQEFPAADLQKRGRFSAAQMSAVQGAPWNERDVLSWLKTFYRVDEPLVRTALALQRSRPTDLQMVYLRAADPVQHYGWNLYAPERYLQPPATLDRDRGLVEGVYRYLDTFLAEFLARLPRDAWLIVASDHGAEPSPLAMSPTMARPGEHGLQAKGVLFMRGPGVRAGARLEGATPYDVAPTLLWLLDLPIARDLPGRPLTEAFTEEFVAAHAARHVPTYGARPTGPLLPSPADPEMLKSLRNLGYIQ